jgi:integrase
MATKPRTLPKLHRGEGSMWWDDDRRQVVYEFRVGGRVVRERGDTAADVMAARRAHLAEANRPKTGLTVGAVLDEWLAFDCHGAPATMDKYRWSVELADPLTAREFAGVRVVDLERLYASLVDRLGRTSLVKLRSHLSMAWEFAVRREYVVANIVRSSKLPAAARAPRKAAWLGRVEFVDMRRHLTTDHSPANTALLTVLLAGLRPGEALGLRWGAVNLDEGLVTVSGALRARSGGRRFDVVDELKTASSRRTVELPPDLVVALRRQHAARRLDTDLVFPTAGGQPINPSNLRRSCTTACRAIGIEAISPHKLRHSFASALLDVGMAPPAVSRALGHADGRMLATTYGHSLDDVVPSARALDQLTG